MEKEKNKTDFELCVAWETGLIRKEYNSKYSYLDI